MFPHLKTLELSDLSSLKSIDDESQNDKVVIGACWSLCQYPTKIDIWDCEALSVLIPWYAVGQMNRLQQLEIKDCKRMTEVLQLMDLPNLKGFFLGMNEFRWPLLDDVMIDGFPQLKMFTHGQSKTPKLKYISTKLGKHSVDCGLNFHGTINEHQNTFPVSASTLDLACSFHNLISTPLLRPNKKRVINSRRTYLLSSRFMRWRQ
ncbi:hypothetical protein QVD17_18244 [Tagetes erecta]|uniref:Uncharacterized protein n=1 Tax=Tagetes erecta TaxID=13708 RepID=A0AAD8KH82_TARER|nr:hypothetical protein QVD17_18244 [Tagetes erecta]